MRRVSGIDAAFLYGETPAWHMHVSAVLIADPSTAPNGFSVERFKELTLETSVAVTGEVKAEPRAPGGFDIGVTGLEIVGPSPVDYPIQPKEHGVDFLLDNRHLWLRSPKQRAIFAVRNEIELVGEPGAAAALDGDAERSLARLLRDDLVDAPCRGVGKFDRLHRRLRVRAHRRHLAFAFAQ